MQSIAMHAELGSSHQAQTQEQLLFVWPFVNVLHTGVPADQRAGHVWPAWSLGEVSGGGAYNTLPIPSAMATAAAPEEGEAGGTEDQGAGEELDDDDETAAQILERLAVRPAV